MITLMLNQNDIPSLTSFDGNIDPDKLKPYIYQAQKHDVKRILGKELYDKIYADYVDDSLTDEYKEIYDEYIIDMLVYFSCAKYTEFGGYRTANNGITKPTQAVNYEEVRILIARYEQLGKSVENAFLEHMKSLDTDLIPEYKDDRENRSTNKVIPWF